MNEYDPTIHLMTRADRREIEEALLMACFADGLQPGHSSAGVEQAAVILGVHSGNAFSEPGRQAIWNAIVRTNLEGIPTTLHAIEAELIDTKMLATAGGRAYLTDLMFKRWANPASIEYYAKRLLELHRRTLTTDLCQRTVARIRDDGETEITEIIRETDQQLVNLLDGQVSDWQSAADLACDTVGRIERGEVQPVLPTGIACFDRQFAGGLRSGQMMTLAALTGIGKSALAIQIAINACHVAPVLHFTLEMDARQIIRRILSMRTGIEGNRLRWANSGIKLSPAELRQLSLADVPKNLFLLDTVGMSAGEFRAKARIGARRFKPGLIVVDYLQLMHDPSAARQSREVEVNRLAWTMKTTARELQLPVIMLCQFNREAAKVKRPRLHQLRESGAIEQHSDIIAILHPHEARDPQNADPNREYRFGLYIDKQRDGPTGELELWFRPSTTAFYELPPEARNGLYERVMRDYAP